MQIIVLFFVLIFIMPENGHTEWNTLQGTVHDIPISCILPLSDNVLLIGTPKHIYKITRVSPHQSVWEISLSLKKDTSWVYALIADNSCAEHVYAATSEGLYKSTDKGNTWKKIFSGLWSNKKVYAIAQHPLHPHIFYLSSQQGLYISQTNGQAWKKMQGPPAHSPLLLLAIPFTAPHCIYAANNTQVFQSRDEGTTWNCLYTAPCLDQEGSTLTYEEDSSPEYTPDAYPTERTIYALLIDPFCPEKIYLGTKRGLLFSQNSGQQWSPYPDTGLTNTRIVSLALWQQYLFAGTKKGLFVYPPHTQQWINLNSEKNFFTPCPALYITAQPPGLFAASHDTVSHLAMESLKRLIRTDPNSTSWPPPKNIISPPQASQPSIRQIQEAAIAYADVNSKKIQDWYRGARKKALFPTLAVSYDHDIEPVIDIDRGGTNDPDQYILGPLKNTHNWGIRLNWDLGNLVWNNDMTSIDTRSRLLVQLRDDILTEVTKLYFERKRLLIRMAANPSLPEEDLVKNQLELEELTARIDALTNGYLSQTLHMQEEMRKDALAYNKSMKDDAQ